MTAAIPQPAERDRAVLARLVGTGELPARKAEAIGAAIGPSLGLGEALARRGLAGANRVAPLVAESWGGAHVDLVREPPDPRLVDMLGGSRCAEMGLVPWRRIGGGTIVATARPAAFDPALLPAALGTCRMVIASEDSVAAALAGLRDREMAAAAERRVEDRLSARRMRRRAPWAVILAALALWLALAPGGLPLALTLWAICTLVATTALRAAAGVLHLCPRPDPPAWPDAPLPVISMMIPLFREDAIAARLVSRLGRLDYPAERLDVILVCEEDDARTRRALAGASLPPWMRIVEVPRARLRTKPRALNYALPFARGSIVGVWDAEDAPEPGQLRAVAARFAAAPSEVVCLQGVLDFYNARANWLSRCFAIEYAAWFRVILPGLERMGLPVPLGGTTLFFRREALEALGGWDAHNVTEDADLGMRIARAGWRTELVRTVTREEANCRVVPWVRQRSRWLKGYAVTYAVHMREPLRLLRELGPWRFAGFQVLLLGTLSQFVLAPLLWTFWAGLLGWQHYVEGMVPNGALLAVIGCFLVSEVTLLAVSAQALAGERHRWLVKWVPVLHLYFPLAAIASYRALWEMARRPFHWDKTAHGITPPRRMRRAA